MYATILATSWLIIAAHAIPSVDNEATAALRAILQQGVTDRTYPGAVAIAGGFRTLASTYKWRKDDIVRPVVFFEEAVGKFSYDEPQLSDEMKVSTRFDIASLTKVVSTTTAVAWLYQRGYLRLDDLVSTHVGPDFARNGKESVTIRHCLLHNAGFAPDPVPWYWDPAFACPNTATEAPAEDFSCLATMIYDSFINETAQTVPGSAYAYSDLGFLALSYVVGTIATNHKLVDASQYSAACKASGYLHAPGVQKQCAFEAFVRTHIFDRVTSHSARSLRRNSAGPWMPSTTYLPNSASWPGIAPTLNDTGAGSYTHKRLQGQTADGDTYAMGGIAGHAGVFSNVGDLGDFISYIVGVTMGVVEDESFLNQTTLKLFTSIQNASQSSRALGWSTNTDAAKDYGYDHSCGNMSALTFMHTGYTGTCLCADPASGLWTAILTTRIYNCQGQLCPSGSSDAVKAVYRSFNSEVNARFA